MNQPIIKQRKTKSGKNVYYLKCGHVLYTYSIWIGQVNCRQAGCKHAK